MRTPCSHLLGGLLLAALLGGCGRGEHGSMSSMASPAAKSSLAALVAASRDCLQYPVERRADGSELWYADYPYFWLRDTKSDKAMMDADGKPLAQGLLASQAVTFMAEHPELESRSYWIMRLARYEQVAKDGKQLERGEPAWLDDFELDSLLAKDAAAHVKD